MSVGEKRMATFAHALVFEILDAERTDVIKVTVCLTNNVVGSPSVRSVKRNLTYETELSMASFRGRQEEKIETVVVCDFDVSKNNRPNGKSDVGSNVSGSMLRGELGLSFVYTDDVEQPSMAHFLACGLCLCPPVTSMPAPSARPTLKPAANVVS